MSCSLAITTVGLYNTAFVTAVDHLHFRQSNHDGKVHFASNVAVAIPSSGCPLDAELIGFILRA